MAAVTFWRRGEKGKKKVTGHTRCGSSQDTADTPRSRLLEEFARTTKSSTMAQSSHEPMERPPRPSKAGSPRTLGSSRARPRPVSAWWRTSPGRWARPYRVHMGVGLHMQCANEGAADSARAFVITEGGRERRGIMAVMETPLHPHMAQFIGVRLGFGWGPSLHL